LIIWIIAGLSLAALSLIRFGQDQVIGTKTEIPVFPPTEMAVWEWRDVSAMDQISLDQLFLCLKKEKINTVFVSINPYLDYLEAPDPQKRLPGITNFTSSLSRFVYLSNQQGITVHALAGGPKWTRKEHFYLNDLVLAYLSNYNQSASSSSRLVGIQWDIEPYTLPDFANNPEYDQKIYLDLISRLATRVSRLSPSLSFGLAIPTWFADTQDGNSLVTWKDSQKVMLKHLLDILAPVNSSYLVVMDYRNTATGPDGSIARAAASMKLINYKQSVKVYLGQESGDHQPAKITFWGKSKNEMKQAVQELYQSYSTNPAFEGFAINDAASFCPLR
jgi:hypothetical protein